MPTRLIIFFVIASLLLVVTSLFVSGRVSQALNLDGWKKRTLSGLWLFLTVGPFMLRFVMSHSMVVRETMAFGLVFGFATLSVALMLLAFSGLRSLGRRVARLFASKPSLEESEALRAHQAEGLSQAEDVSQDITAKVDAPSSVSPTVLPALEEALNPTVGRRDFVSTLATSIALPVGFGTAGYAALVGRHDYRVEEVPVPLTKLPRQLDGYTIVQLSDIHVGGFVGDFELKSGKELTRSARPDLIVLTGDLVDHDASYIPDLGRWVRQLVELGARDGVVVIPGNHDYYAGVEDILRVCSQAGARILRNNHLRIGSREAGFVLAGVDDVWAPRVSNHRPDLQQALGGASPDDAKVLLCHNPEFYPEAAEYVDLQLSGHTHGGQINPLVRPADWVLGHGYIAGHYFRGASQIYVNRGFGTAGPPARLGAPPEVSKIILTST